MAVSKKQVRIPDLSNATIPFLVDELGLVRMRAKVLKILEGIYKEAFNAQRSEGQYKGLTQLSGDSFQAVIIEFDQVKYDQTAMKQFILKRHGADKLAEFERPGHVVQVRTPPIVPLAIDDDFMAKINADLDLYSTGGEDDREDS